MIQVCPLYRVILAVGFCSGDLRLKPCCGWSAQSKRFHMALFQMKG